MLNNFAGCGDTETVDASTTTAAFVLGFESNDVLVTVDSDVVAFFIFASAAGTDATVATATHHMCKGTATFSKPRGHKYGSVILAAGAAKIYLTPGNGL